MKYFNNYILKFRYIILIGIILLGFLLRSNNLYTWPRLGATFDEYAWTWLGISLIQNHLPTSWSPHLVYSNAKDITYQKTHFRLVTPYLEHPPLFGLVVGSYALLSGVRDMYHLDLQHIRGLALALGIFSIIMVYFFTTEIYGLSIGLVAAFLYSVTPTVVIGSRLVQNENFFIPFFLLSLFLIAKFVKTKNKILFYTSAIICGLLALAKVPWLIAGVSICLIFMYLRQYKNAIIFGSITILVFSVFFLYGILLDSKLFFALWQLQLHRYDIAFNSFFALFTSPYLVDRFFVDGWIYFGWLALTILFTKDIKKNYMLLLPFISYLLIFIFAIPNEPSHGWYRYPFYPFIIIATAVFLKEYFNKNYILTFIFLIFTGLSMLQLSWANSLGFSFTIFRFFLFLFGLSMIPLFIPKTAKLAAVTSYLSLVIIFILNIWTILVYNEQ